MTRLSQYLRFVSALSVLGAACFALAVQAQEAKQARISAAAPHEIRYCTNCATVEAVNAAPGAAGVKKYELVIRYADGKMKTFRYDNDPGLRVGEKVKDNNGVVVRDTAGRPAP
ncbi:MAG: hypothetical protein ACXW2U_15425 [Telluria sp.]